MMNVLFFGAIALYLAATILQFSGMVFKKPLLDRLALIATVLGLALHTAYAVWRGVAAGRVPMANQFEFAAAFAWGVVVIGLFMRWRTRAAWVSAAALPAAFLALSYAALLPREITEMMPALKSAWFTLHIGSAVFSYAAFALAGCAGVRYLLMERKIRDEGDPRLKQLDHFSYRLVTFGFLLLTVVILSGCVWAEQAWSTFWSWDPKETWALITWIIYAIYLHQRLRKGWRGRRMAWFTLAALVCVLFTFIGVNTLLPGLHSYA